MTKKIIKHNVLIREKGKLYYIDKHGNLCSAEMKTGGKKGRTFKKKK